MIFFCGKQETAYEMRISDWSSDVCSSDLPVATATTFSEYVYEIDGNWKLTYDNFQENYHLRFIHPRSGGGGAVGPDNPFGYPTRYGFHGESRTQTIWTNPAPKLSATQMLAFGKLVPTLMQKGLMSSPHGREIGRAHV